MSHILDKLPSIEERTPRKKRAKDHKEKVKKHSRNRPGRSKKPAVWDT